MSKNAKIIFSFIILFIGILITFSEYFNSKKIQVYDYINELYYNETVEIDELEEIEEVNVNDEVVMNNEEEVVEDTKEYSFNYNINYIGYLNIPKINFNKGFTRIGDEFNNVNKNIEILSTSDYPDTDNGNVIIAGHSGNSSVSFFNKLYLLQIGDVAYIKYNNKTYTYQISKIYKVEKNGKVEIIRNKNRKTLTLITCTKDDKLTQTVYIADLINEE